MRVTYSPATDSAYIYLRQIDAGDSKHQCPVECESANAMIVLDIDGEGRLIGIEVLGARNGLPAQLLALAPE
jgi:uncharacterized protein YuzE